MIFIEKLIFSDLELVKGGMHCKVPFFFGENKLEETIQSTHHHIYGCDDLEYLVKIYKNGAFEVEYTNAPNLGRANW